MRNNRRQQAMAYIHTTNQAATAARGATAMIRVYLAGDMRNPSPEHHEWLERCATRAIATAEAAEEKAMDINLERYENTALYEDIWVAHLAAMAAAKYAHKAALAARAWLA